MLTAIDGILWRTQDTLESESAIFNFITISGAWSMSGLIVLPEKRMIAIGDKISLTHGL